MAGITLAQAQANLDQWITAQAAMASGESEMVEYSGRRVQKRRYTADEILKQIAFWDQKIKELTPASAGGRRRVRYVVPE